MNVFHILLILPAFAFAVDCTNLADGVYEQGCRSYATCTHGVESIVDCPPAMVFDNSTKACKDPSAVQTICGRIKDCTGKADGKYADTETHCLSYYTCNKGAFLDHNLCVGGLVFDEVKQTCNWPNNVAPPCGTLQASSGK